MPVLVGKMPYDESKATKQLLEEMRGQNFRWHKHPSLSDLCKKVVQGMFTWNFRCRPYVSDLMKYAWFSAVLPGAGLGGIRAAEDQKESERSAMSQASSI